MSVVRLCFGVKPFKQFSLEIVHLVVFQVNHLLRESSFSVVDLL